MLVDAAMLSSSPHHLYDSVCFMRFVGTVIENQGGAHRRQWVCMYCVDTVLKCLPCFLRFLSHYVDVWLSGWCRELVDRGLTLGWAQITAMVAHKVVHWVRQVSPLSFWATLLWSKISAKARILGCINVSSHAYKDRVAAHQLELWDIGDFSFFFIFWKRVRLQTESCLCALLSGKGVSMFWPVTDSNATILKRAVIRSSSCR